MLKFELIEKEFSYDSGEILLFNETDKSFVTRTLVKVDDGFVYQIESDIIQHFGKWQGQLQLVNNGEIYTSKPFQFTIENDLSSVSPPQLIDINSWATLKQSAIDLIDDMQNVIGEYDEAAISFQQSENNRIDNEKDRIQAESTRQNHETTRQDQERVRERNEVERKANEVSRVETFNANEATRQENETVRLANESGRQQAEQGRVSAESIRVENEKQRILTHDSLQERIDMIGKVKLGNLVENGNFKRGLENWLNLEEQTALSVENEDLKVVYVTKVDNVFISNRNKVEYKDNMYYSIVRFNPVNLKGSVRLRHNGDYRQSKNIGGQNEFQTVSSVFKGSGSGNQTEFRMFGLDTKAGDYFYIDYFMLFDLTHSFGAGNEPSKEAMDWVIKENGYFEELTISRDDIQQYEINQLRKAVLALGGSI